MTFSKLASFSLLKLEKRWNFLNSVYTIESEISLCTWNIPENPRRRDNAKYDGINGMAIKVIPNTKQCTANR